MPFPFAHVCNLLDECYSLCVAGKPYEKTIVTWFASHGALIHANDTCLVPLLSTLLPEKRPDRVYSIQTSRLVNIIARALILGSSRIIELTRFERPGSGVDLADCVESILTATPNPLLDKTSFLIVEDIDKILQAVASKVKWSSPAIRRHSTSLSTPGSHVSLEAIYRKLSAREAKWFTRLVLKNYQPLVLDCNLVYRCCHPLLPLVLKFHDDFASAVKVLQDAKAFTTHAPESKAALKAKVLESLRPQIGIKVARQNWLKARSIKHCIDLGHGRMSVETKMDGEYCQVHVDVAHGLPRLQIFSKSGKDSTEDRLALHSIIAESLKLGFPGCKIHKRCILEGELVVYSDEDNKILPFHKIRNHVTRRGVFMNTEEDSPPQRCEHLMIVYFDILLLDDQSLLATRHSERMKILEKTIIQRRGWSELIPRQVIDFQNHHATSDLRKAFANIIVTKGEGLVLKPDEPYFKLDHRDMLLAGCCIKLKKEYIGNFGDVGDFAVVGAGFNAAEAKSYNMPNLKWTRFFIGCATNKDQARHSETVPDYTVVSVVELNRTQLKTLMVFGKPFPIPALDNKATKVRIPRGIETSTPMTVAFQNPPVFDLRCFSFDKPGNVGFWTLQFPVVSKIHFDRDCADTVSFGQLQQMAREATTAPGLEDSQENLAWIARLESADRIDPSVDAMSQTTTTTTVSTQSSCLHSTQNTGHVLSPEFKSKKRPLSSDRMDSTWPLRKRQRLNEAQEMSASSARLVVRDSIGCTASKAVGASCNLVKTQPHVDDVKRKGLTAVHGRHLANLCNQEYVAPSGCCYAGRECSLAGLVVLLCSVSLKESPEPAALLKAHGILNTAMCLNAWLQVKAKSQSSEKPSQEIILLVDSVENPMKVKEVLKRIKIARKELPRCGRVRMTIYDWRVLKHLSIREDESTKEKYYDGFNDPWRRWYCGVI